MSRHRMVRTMNYEDEYYDEEDEYSHSVEDNYCISPSTAAQFTWTREKNMDFAAYMGQEAVINEEEEETQEDASCDSFNDSAKTAQLGLSELDQAKLNSCLEEARNILGESVSESVMTSVIIQNGYNLEASINQLLSQQDAPKPQREPRQRKSRTQDDIDTLDLDNLLAEIEGVEKFVGSDVGNFSDANCTMSKNKTFQSKMIVCQFPSQNLVSTMSNSSVKSNNSTNVSLSDLVKQHQKVHIKCTPSNLTEHARQHQKGVSPVRSVLQTDSDPNIHSSGFTNLSDLIADYSKGQNSSVKKFSFSSLSPHASQSLGNLSGATVKNKSDSSETSPSLSELVKLHSQTEKNKTDDFHKSQPFEKDNAAVHLGSLIKDLSLGKSKPQDTVSVIRSSSASAVLPDSFSLASCLKTKKSTSSSVNSPQLKQVKPDKKNTIVQDLRENVHPGLMKGSIVQNVDTGLISQASYFGLVLCGSYRKRKNDQFSSSVKSNRGIKHPKFLCKAQLCNVPLYTPTLLHFIKPFDFSTPSPDDIVKNKQKQAFMRSDKEFTI